MKRSFLFALVLPVALAALAGAQVPQTNTAPPPATETNADATDVPETATTLPAPIAEASTLLIAGETEKAAKILREMDTKALSPVNQSRWRLLAARAALRLGDRAWLTELNQQSTFADSAVTAQLIAAMRQLLANDLTGTRKTLSQISESQLNGEIPRRRYYTLWARLEQMSGNPDAERVHITKLVQILSQWAEPQCQVCHANPRKYGEAITTLDVKNQWFLDRYAHLISRSEAEQMVKEETKRLTTTPEDAHARLRLIAALRATGQSAEADKNVEAFSWANAPGREVKKPLRFAPFP